MAHGATTKNDRVWRQLREKIRGIAHKVVKVGWLSDGSMSLDGKISLADLALIQEIGTEDGHVPAREPLRRTFEEHEGQAEVSRVCERLGRQLVAEKLEVERALEILGDYGANMVKRRIKMGLPPPNAPSTVAAKGSSAPLIDTGYLVNGVTWAVK